MIQQLCFIICDSMSCHVIGVLTGARQHKFWVWSLSKEVRVGKAPQQTADAGTTTARSEHSFTR